MNVWSLPRSECRSVVLDVSVRFTIAPDYTQWDRVFRERVQANIDRRERHTDNIAIFHRRQA